MVPIYFKLFGTSVDCLSRHVSVSTNLCNSVKSTHFDDLSGFSSTTVSLETDQKVALDRCVQVDSMLYQVSVIEVYYSQNYRISSSIYVRVDLCPRFESGVFFLNHYTTVNTLD